MLRCIPRLARHGQKEAIVTSTYSQQCNDPGFPFSLCECFPSEYRCSRVLLKRCFHFFLAVIYGNTQLHRDRRGRRRSDRTFHIYINSQIPDFSHFYQCTYPLLTFVCNGLLCLSTILYALSRFYRSRKSPESIPSAKI